MPLTDNQKILLALLAAYLIYRYSKGKEEGFAVAPGPNQAYCSQFTSQKTCYPGGTKGYCNWVGGSAKTAYCKYGK